MKQPDGGRGRVLKLLAGCAVSIVLIWLSFRKVDFHGAWMAVRTVQVLPLLGGVALATLSFPLRVPRWRELLRQEDGEALPVAPLWHAIAIGFAANNVLLARAGEVLRVAAISRNNRVTFAAALSSVAVERVLDALTVVTLLGIGLVTAHLPPGIRIGKGPPIATIAETTGLLCLAALVLAIIAAWRRDLALQLLEKILPTGNVSTKLVGFVDNVLRGLGAMRDWRRAIPVILWSIAIWTVNAAGFFLVFKAFGFPVPFSGALILQGALMLAIAAPSTPGYVGIMEPVIIGALALFAVDNTAAGAYAIVYHATTFVPITLLGAYSAFRTGTRLRAPATA